jgi:5-bromo-4-chloroindolyl phosphate hydrolysis protein
MMDYYLPTTIKLLQAYEEMDRQPIQSEKINSSKREIEQTLDTLNDAFTKLLDTIFQEKAWDVSSDISVLNTILAQEGLTGSALKK